MSFFAYPWMLFGLLVALVVIIYYCFCKPQCGVVLPELPGKIRQMRRFRWVTAPWSGILYSFALLLLVLALARPRLGDEKFIVRNQGIDMVMIIDLSGSMQAVDVPENITSEKALEQILSSGELKNRLDSAKSVLGKFIQSRPNDRIGLIGFAEYGYNLAPPTLDHDWLTASLDMLEPGIIGDATGIASPVASAIRRLDESAAPRRVMVLFTDGRNNVTHRLTPLQTAELAREKGIILYTVGIGGRNAFMSQDGFWGRRFVRYPNEFDEELLKEMAAVTGGKYFRAADTQAMQEVMDEINSLEKTNFEHPRYIEYREFAPTLALAALLLILIAVWSENTFERSLP